MLDFKRLDETQEGQARHFADRLRQAAEWAIPKEQAPKALDLKIEFVKDAPRFTAFTLKGREARIIVGGPTETLPDDPVALRKIVAAMLFARCGLPVEKAESGFPEWLVDGLARKAVGDARRPNIPGGTGFPGALALASANRLPSLRSLLDSPLKPEEDGACFELYAEYCQLLLSFCGKAGLPQAGVFRAVVMDAASPKPSGRYDVFATAAAVALAPKPKDAPEGSKGKEAKAKPESKLSPEDVSSWHAAEQRRALRNCFTPVPARQIESAFKDASRISYKDKDGVERQCELDDLCSKWSSIPDVRLAVAGAKLRLTEIFGMAPLDLQDALWQLNASLNALLAAPEAPKSDALAPAVKNFYDALERRIALEAWLKRCERARLSPAERFEGTLDSLAALHEWEEAPFRKEAALLDAHIAKEARK